jgi:outer membrane protein assembly factor BamB
MVFTSTSKKYRAFGCVLIAAILFVLLPIFSRGVLSFWLKQPASSFPLALKWQVDLGTSSYDYPAYQDGLIVMPVHTTLTSYWYGIEATSGQVIWKRLFLKQGLGFYNYLRCLTPEYLVISGPWSLYTLKARTGQLLWGKERADTATCSDSTVFYSGVPRDSITAVEISTGRELWGATTPRKSVGSVIYNFETEEIIARDIEFFIVEPESGRIKQSFQKSGRPPDGESAYRGPMYLIDRGQLFIGGTVLDASTGEVIHQEELYTSYRPTITVEAMYLSTFSSGVVAFDRSTFEIQWTYQPKRLIGGQPVRPISSVAVLNEVGYAVFSDATLGAFDLETGQELGYWQMSWFDLARWPVCTALWPGCITLFFSCSPSAQAGLTTSEDTLFVSFGDGKLYAFGQ